MPELPEVEVVTRGLKSKIIGHQITGVEVDHPKVVGGSIEDFKKLTEGAKVKTVERIGKLILIHLSNNNVVFIHLKLTGQLIYLDKNGKGYKGGHSQKAYDVEPPSKYTHVTFNFKDGSHLYFNDLRKFGWVKVFSEEDYKANKGPVSKIMAGLGPDPTAGNFNVGEFVKRVKRRAKSTIYQVLMDQKVVAGLGNIYVNELLWRNKINPQTKAGELKDEQLKHIAKGINPIFAESIKYGGSSANTFVQLDGSKGTYTQHLDVYKREGEKCHRNDGGTIKRVKMGGRSAFFCPVCQK